MSATMSMHPVAVSDMGQESDHMGRRGVAADAHADAVWVFEPLIGVGSLPPESQSYAAEVYAQVAEKMLPEITEAVAKGCDAFSVGVCGVNCPGHWQTNCSKVG